MRGLEKAALPFAMLAMAGATPHIAESNEAPKTISSGSRQENVNSYLKYQAAQLGRLILNHRTELLRDNPVPGEATAIIHKTDIVGLVSADMMAVMHEINGQPDPKTVEAVQINASIRDSKIAPDGDYTIVVDKKIKFFSPEVDWQAEQCVKSADKHFISGCYGTDPTAPNVTKIDAYQLMADIVDQVSPLILYPTQYPAKKN